MGNQLVKSVWGAAAAVSSGHPLATLHAREAIERGGSLIDAMVAASAILTVALPHTSSLGGCGMLLYFDAASGKVHGLNGSGRAPLRATPHEFPKGMPRRGVRAAVVPTLVRMWARAHERFGKLPLARLLQPAISLAEDGMAVGEEVAKNLRSADEGLRGQPGFSAWMLPGGRTPKAGETLRQSAVAGVLRLIAEGGEVAFYQGKVAENLVRFSEANGGLFTLEDFALAQADWVCPWRADAMGHQVHVMPPNSVGVLMLQQLQRWDAVGSPAGEGDVPAAIDAAMRLIAAGRHRIGDTTRTPMSANDFGVMTHEGAPPLFSAARADIGDTTGIAAMDRDGNAVAMLQSVFQPFGSGAFDASTGILLNNRMFDFSSQPGEVNSVGPSVRPSHTLNPWLVTRGGEALIAGVSPGGVSQTTTGFQLVTGALGGEMTLGQLVTRPRWSLSRDGDVLLEPGMPASLADALRARDMRVEENSAHEFYFGSAKIVRRTPNGWIEAAADIRRQASALAW
jgi:gamma-glutamyltranspeptidase/glutathione hydrolase